LRVGFESRDADVRPAAPPASYGKKLYVGTLGLGVYKTISGGGE
jgi:hypothetical protein